MTNILVTGANGQLGRCIQDISQNHPNLNFTFVSRSELPIEQPELLQDYFRGNKFDYCINTAAYTNVEKAESEEDLAFKINAESVKNLAEICNELNIVLIHISTDYVFNGKKGSAYLETDQTDAINVYGASKLKGEQNIQEAIDAYFILRTSWLYSQHGHNFFKTICRLANEQKPMKITDAQTGVPTNANDLAEAIVGIVTSGSKSFGVYHFSNEGYTTWYGFAKAILELNLQLPAASLEKSNDYVTFAERPAHSVLDCTKFKQTFNRSIPDWKESLQSLITSINQNRSI